MTSFLSLFLTASFVFAQNSLPMFPGSGPQRDPRTDPEVILDLDEAIWRNATKSDLTPVEFATYLLDHESWEFQVLKRVRPYVVDVVVGNQSYSGIIVGFSSRNQPLILSSAQVVYYDHSELLKRDVIALSDPHDVIQGSLLVPESSTVMPAWKSRDEENVTSQGWHGVPLYHPIFHVGRNGIVDYQGEDNFSISMMVNRTVRHDSRTEHMAHVLYTLDDALNAQFPEDTVLSPLVIATPYEYSQVLILGRANHLHPSFNNNSPAEPRSYWLEQRMSYSVGSILDKEKTQKWAAKNSLTIDSEKEFVINGAVDLGMMGAGVFNSNGELLGMVSKIIRNTSRANGQWWEQLGREKVELEGAVVLRADYLQRVMRPEISNNKYLKGLFAQQDFVFKSCQSLF